jgi:hypothetical protein
MTIDLGPECGVTLRTVLFESDEAAAEAITGAVRAVPDRLQAMPAALSAPARAAALTDIGATAGDFLRADLAGLLCSGWQKYAKLRAAAWESLTEPGVKRIVDVDAHTVTWTHDPSVEVIYDHQRILQVPLTIRLEVDVVYLVVDILDGFLTAVRGGSCRGVLSLAVAAAPPFRRAVDLDLGIGFRLRRPIPLARPDTPDVGPNP